MHEDIGSIDAKLVCCKRVAESIATELNQLSLPVEFGDLIREAIETLAEARKVLPIKAHERVQTVTVEERPLSYHHETRSPAGKALQAEIICFIRQRFASKGELEPVSIKEICAQFSLSSGAVRAHLSEPITKGIILRSADPSVGGVVPAPREH